MHRFDPPRRNRLYRSRDNRVFFGVCGGIAEHFDFSPLGVRLIFAVVALFTPPAWALWIILYIVLGLMLKEAPPRPFATTDEEEFWNTCQSSRSAALGRIRRRYEMIDKRLQRIETIVTSPRFELDRKCRDL